MPAARTTFSAETRAELRQLFAGRPAPVVEALIQALEISVIHWRRMQRLGKEGDEQDRADLVWLRRLAREIEAGGREFSRLARELDAFPAEAARHRNDPVPALYVEPLLTRTLRAVSTEIRLRTPRAGRKSRFVLNLNLARALAHYGVALTKSRSGLTHRVFAVVYAELGLAGDAGDVFHAVRQGVDIVRTGRYVRYSPAARQVLQPPSKKR